MLKKKNESPTAACASEREWSWRHERRHHFVCDFASHFLMHRHDRFECFDENLLDLRSHHTTTLILRLDVRELSIVRLEECQPLIRHIDFRVPALQSMLL